MTGKLSRACSRLVAQQLDGTLLLTPEEVERQRAIQAEAQIIQIARNLLQADIASDRVAAMTGLTVAQVEALRDC